MEILLFSRKKGTYAELTLAKSITITYRSLEISRVWSYFSTTLNLQRNMLGLHCSFGSR